MLICLTKLVYDDIRVFTTIYFAWLDDGLLSLTLSQDKFHEFCVSYD